MAGRGGIAGGDGLWKALASEHRRRILDVLRDGPATTSAIAAGMPHLSRYAVMQHLGVLTGAGLVLVRREGRHRFNYLNAVPLREAYERWVSRLADRTAAGSVALRRHVERSEQGAGMTGTDDGARAVRLEHEMRIAATVERVWKAITDEQAQWYPHTYGGERVEAIVFEHRVGGSLYEDWGGGAGHSYGTVIHYDPPAVYGTRGHLNGAITLEQWVRLEADGDGTIMRSSTVAFGPISEEMAAGIRSHGDMANFEEALRAFVEG